MGQFIYNKVWAKGTKLGRGYDTGQRVWYMREDMREMCSPQGVNDQASARKEK